LDPEPKSFDELAHAGLEGGSRGGFLLGFPKKFQSLSVRKEQRGMKGRRKILCSTRRDFVVKPGKKRNRASARARKREKRSRGSKKIQKTEEGGGRKSCA